ncbi:hypothetical protein FNF27_06898 [Cafeteria roenbergensis]|uniref:Uncharacterized protein n=1 Tax=Cafeteria roenbergensis TaxID=33653 RepID=A0A5A8DYQ7_CAFRO|nr:hypothetical protein FNF27_06898 [Cafeteria roenbergensis]
MELNGTVSVSGAYGRGGGAGGSLLVVASRLSGSGTLSADGGAATSNSNGGSGGRIAIHAYQPARNITFTGTVRARAGPLSGSWGTQAAAGTVYWCDGRVSDTTAASDAGENTHRCGVRRLEVDNGDLRQTTYQTQLVLPPWRRNVAIDDLRMGNSVQLSVPPPAVFDPVAMPLNRTTVVVGRLEGLGSDTSAIHSRAGVTVVHTGLRPGAQSLRENGDWRRSSMELAGASATVEEHGWLVLPPNVAVRDAVLTVRGEVRGVRSLTLEEGSSASLAASGATWLGDAAGAELAGWGGSIPASSSALEGWEGWACSQRLSACASRGRDAASSSDQGRYAFGSLRLLDDATLTLGAGVSTLGGVEALEALHASRVTVQGPQLEQLRIQSRDWLRVGPGASIRADGAGYVSDTREASCFGGGSGEGGLHGGGPAGQACGDYEWPVLAGAGGDGGSGGGSVMLVCNATESSAMELNGTVSVSGAYGRGGGAGGSLLVVASRLSGSGTLSADGGAATSNSNGGSGGRIAIHAYQPARNITFTGTVRARAGPLSGSWGTQAAAGTVYWCDGRVSDTTAASDAGENTHRCGVRRLEVDNGDLRQTTYQTQLVLPPWRRNVAIDDLRMGNSVQLSVPPPAVFDPVAMPLNRTTVVVGRLGAWAPTPRPSTAAPA